jgi:DNA-binding NarL/FixJ family response regulator
MSIYINYILIIIGIATVLLAATLIFLDRLKGEDACFNIVLKEQELKKVMEDAEEIISELNYTSEQIVNEIDGKIKDLRAGYKSAPIPDILSVQHTAPSVVQPAAPRPAVAVSKNREEIPAENLTPKQKAVLKCAEQGMGITDIAKNLEIGQGEVMLILSLRNKEV